MKKDDEFALENEEYDDDARAVNESELLPIFEAMNFSGDIQPLEDVEAPEPVMADYFTKKKTDTKSAEKKISGKKKKIPVISGFNRLTQLVIAAAVALIVIGGAGFGVHSLVENTQNTQPVKAIFSSDRVTYINLVNGKKNYEISDAEDVRVSSDGMRVYYSRNTSSKTGKFDIRYVDAGKVSSLKRGGSNICSGIDDGWSVNSDGSFMCYSITKAGTRQFYLFSAEEGKSEEISADIEEVFLPPTGDVVYFTRRNGSIYSLHRMRYGENPQNVASGISHVRFCGSEKGFEVIYTVETGEETNLDVFSVKDMSEPVQICSDVSEIYLNDYVYGGNLYYFKKNNSSVNWQDFISDPYFESDAKMTKPVESDYMTEYGFIIKRYILDKSAYDAAVAKYNSKLGRDEIREELNKIDFGLAADTDYSCYVYNHVSNKLLTTGVALKNIIAFSSDDAPRILFRKSVINVDSQITMDKLVKLASKSKPAGACDYVRENVEDSYEVSDDCIYAWFDGSKVIQYNVEGYSKKTQFYLDSRKNLYAFDGGNLYCNDITQTDFGKKTKIESDVSGCELDNGYIYFTKAGDSDAVTVYRYSRDAGLQKLGEQVYSYVALDSGSVALFTKQENSDSEGVALQISDGQTTERIDTEVSLGHFVYRGDSLAYIRDIGTSDVPNAGDMYIYIAGESSKKIGGDITDIKYIKEGLSVKDISED